MRAAGQPDFLQQLFGARARVGDAGDLHGHGHILVRRQRRNQVEELEDETHLLATQSCELVFAQPGNVHVVDEYGAGRGCVEAGDQPEQRGLPAAGRADDGDEFSVRNLNRQRMQDGERLTAAHDRFRHVAQFNHVLGRLLASAMGFRTAHTLSATIRAPAAVGWMPSLWFKVSSPATPCSKNGTSATWYFAASAGYTL